MINLTSRTQPIPAGAATDADERAHRAATGWSYSEALTVLLDQFDRNGDGMLSDDRILGMRLFTEARTNVYGEWRISLAFLEGRSGRGLVRVRDITTWSHDRLLEQADVNRDHIATRTELASVVRTYDADADGRLSVDEFTRLRAELGAERLRTWRDVQTVTTKSPRR